MEQNQNDSQHSENQNVDVLEFPPKILDYFLANQIEQESLDKSFLEYKSAIENVAKNNKELVFDNSNSTHAAIVLATILENSERIVRIYDQDLRGDIADKYFGLYKSLNNFIQKGKMLKILTNETDKDDKVFKFLNIYKKDYNCDNIIVKVINNKSETNLYNNLVFFAVGDEEAFRLEKHVHHEENTENRMAICSFQNIKMAGKLIEQFDNQFNECKENLI